MSFKGLALAATYYLFSDTSHFHFSVSAIYETGSSNLLTIDGEDSNKRTLHRHGRKKTQKQKNVDHTSKSHIKETQQKGRKCKKENCQQRHNS